MESTMGSAMESSSGNTGLSFIKVSLMFPPCCKNVLLARKKATQPEKLCGEKVTSIIRKNPRKGFTNGIIKNRVPFVKGRKEKNSGS